MRLCLALPPSQTRGYLESRPRTQASQGPAVIHYRSAQQGIWGRKARSKTEPQGPDM